MRSFQNLANSINTFAGKAAALFSLILVLCTVADVCARYFFQSGSIALQELEWHLFSLIFLLGSAWAFQQDGHVRIDILFCKLSKRTQSWINIIGGVLFLLPFCALVAWASLDFVIASFEVMESSPDAGGLPFRFIIKSSITIGFVLLFLSGVADILKNVDCLRAAKIDA